MDVLKNIITISIHDNLERKVSLVLKGNKNVKGIMSRSPQRLSRTRRCLIPFEL